MRFMLVVSPAAATGRACSGAPCLITYQSGPIRMEARLGEIRRERKGEAEADAQQKCFTCAYTPESIPQLRHVDRARSPRPSAARRRDLGAAASLRLRSRSSSSQHLEVPLLGFRR